MTTINISLPEKLKEQADNLVQNGYYASFSDLVRMSLRHAVDKSKYDAMIAETEEDIRTGKAVTISTKKDLKDYMDSL